MTKFRFFPTFIIVKFLKIIFRCFFKNFFWGCNIFSLQMTMLNSKKLPKHILLGARVSVLFLMVISMMLLTVGSSAFGEKDNKIQSNESLTRPTFGVDHQESKTIVDNGFRFNDKTFAITNNFHTPFRELPINIGEFNSFEAKVYAEKKLKVQEFLFGIPIKGEAHLAELGVEVWYDLFGDIQDIKVVQNSNVIDGNSVRVTNEKSQCNPSDAHEKCDVTAISMIFLEPLRDKVMAIKAIDYENRYQITYLNDGFDISGQSLNPLDTMMIPSPVRNEGLIQLTQTEKYSPHWIAGDGRTFEKNEYGSFKQINQSFERFQDKGEPRTRLHSEFGGMLASEQERAMDVFDAGLLIADLPESFAYVFPDPHDRMTEEIIEKMLEEERKCQQYLEDSDKQTRDY